MKIKKKKISGAKVIFLSLSYAEQIILKHKNVKQKSCIRETLNLLTCADSSTNINTPPPQNKMCCVVKKVTVFRVVTVVTAVTVV